MAAGPIVLIEDAINAQPEESGFSDLLLERCIDAASEVIEAYCARAFATATYDVRHSGDAASRASDRLWLAAGDTLRATFPVTTVTAITEDGTSLTIDRVPLGMADFSAGELAVVLDHRGQVYRAYGDGEGCATPKSWSGGWANIRVQYVAGYTPATMPAGIKQVCIDLAWLFYREGGRFGVESLSISEMSARFIRMLPPWSKEALNQCRVLRQPVTAIG